VVAYLLTLGLLVARTQIMDDDRYGFCMFRYLAKFRVEYAWVHSDGTVEPYTPVPRDARRHSLAAVPQKDRDLVLGLGASRAWILGFLKHRWDREHPDGSQMQAVMIYRIYDGPEQSETFVYPAEKTVDP